MTTDADNTPLDPVIGDVMHALDLAVVEWEPDNSFRPLSISPRWFTGTVPWSSLPFLEHFVNEARRFLHDHVGGVLASDQFIVQSRGDELLLRARALKVRGRLIVAIERLEGGADIRPILREARQQALDHEVLADNARAIHAPLDRVARAAADLHGSGLSEVQRTIADALARSLTELQTAAAALPPARKRR